MFYKEMSTFQLFDTSHHVYCCIDLADFVSCGIALFWFPDEGPPRIETRSNFQYDIW